MYSSPTKTATAPVHAREMPEKEDGTAPAASKTKYVVMQNNESSAKEEAVSEVVDQLASLKVADVGDPELWKPHPPTEECPICFVPLPLADAGKTYWACCGNIICSACIAETARAERVINAKRAKKKQSPLAHTCPFCRTEPKFSESNYEKRMRNGDGQAAFTLAYEYREGNARMNVPKDFDKSLELLHHAADDLGDSAAMMRLGGMYSFGRDGVEKDDTKGRKYLEDAVKEGNVGARCLLACFEDENGNIKLAIRHWKLAAEAGHSFATEKLWAFFYKGALEKAELEEMLRAHKEACDSMNSEERKRDKLFEELQWLREVTEKTTKAQNDLALFMLLRSYYIGEINAKQLKAAMIAHQNGNLTFGQNGILTVGPVSIRYR